MTKKVNNIKILSVSFLMTILSLSVLAQTDISGVYYDNAKSRIEVYGNNFILVQPQKVQTVFQRSIFAQAYYVWENDKFIQLRNYLQFNSPQIEIKYREWNRKRATNIKITVIIPNVKYREIITELSYYTPESGLYKRTQKPYNNRQRKTSFYIPRTSSSVCITVRPKKINLIDSDRYNSYVRYMGCFEIDNSIKDTDIIIQDLDDDYFGQYYVDGDYVRVEGDRLYWRGRVFEKSYAPEDIRYIEEKESALKK